MGSTFKRVLYPIETLLERTSFSFAGGCLFGDSCVRDSGLCPLLLSAYVVHYAQTSASPVYAATISVSEFMSIYPIVLIRPCCLLVSYKISILLT